MAQSVGRLPKRFVMLFMALIIIVGTLIPGAVVTPAQAALLPLKRTYIQTTIDTSSWEILAGVISYQSGWGGNQAESKRIGKSNLDLLAAADTPSSNQIYDLVDPNQGAAGGNSATNLVLCFPGKSTSGWFSDSSAEDTARAQLIRNSLIYDLNAAFKFVYGDESGFYTPQVTSGEGNTIDAQIKQYSEDLQAFLSHIPGSAGESFDKNGAKIVATQVPQNPVDAEIAAANYGADYYVTIQRGDEVRTFCYRMLKGYGEQGLGLPYIAEDRTKYIHWATLAVEAFINYYSDEELQVTPDNVYDGTPGAIENAVAGLFNMFANWVANTLGLWNFDELIFNGGVRGTAGYIGGVFPSSWERVIWTFFFFSEIAAIVILLYAIIYNVGKKAMATIDPVARASAIEQIKYLFIVAFLLAVIPIVLPLLISVSYELTGIFHDALGGATAEERFHKLSSNSGGLGAALTYLLYLGALLYFNVFYVFRALAIGLLIILGPIFVAMMALSENKRQLAMAWFKEFCANLFIQPLQALMLSFILLVPDSGRNIDSIVMAYVMIPLTNLLRQMFFGNSGGLADRVGQQGRHTGINMAQKAGGVALGAAAGAIGGGVAAVVSGVKTAKGSKEAGSSEGGGKEAGGGANGPNTKGVAGSGAANGAVGDGGAEKKGEAKNEGKAKAGAGANGDPVKAGAAGTQTTLGEKAAENIGDAGGGDNTDDKAPDGGSETPAEKETGGGTGSSGRGAGETINVGTLEGLKRVGKVVGGVGLAAIGGAGLGALGGALGGRRYFSGPGGGGLIKQLSTKAAQKGGAMAAEGITGRTANGGASGAGALEGQPLATATDRQKETLGRQGKFARGGNAYTDTAKDAPSTKQRNADGSSTYSHVDKAAQAKNGYKAHTADKDSFVANYDKNKMAANDWSNLEQIQNLWENGSDQEKEGLKALGITGFTPTYSWNPETGKDELSGATITYDNQKAKENLGLSFDKNTGLMSSTVQGDAAPQFVPDANSLLNTQRASAAVAASRMEDKGFDHSYDPKTDMVTLRAKADKFQTGDMAEPLMKYASAATVDKDGYMSMSVPQAELANISGPIATSSNTMLGRSLAVNENAAPGFTPSVDSAPPAVKTTSVALHNAGNHFAGQNVTMKPADDSGDRYTFTGSNEAMQNIVVPTGVGESFIEPHDNGDGTSSVTLTRQQINDSFSAHAVGESAQTIQMAPPAVQAGVENFRKQGIDARVQDGQVVINSQRMDDIKSVYGPKAVVETAANNLEFNSRSNNGRGGFSTTISFDQFTAGDYRGVDDVGMDDRYGSLDHYLEPGKEKDLRGQFRKHSDEWKKQHPGKNSPINNRRGGTSE